MQLFDFVQFLGVIIPFFVVEILFGRGIGYNFRDDLIRLPVFDENGQKWAVSLMGKYDRILSTLVIAYTVSITSVVIIAKQLTTQPGAPPTPTLFSQLLPYNIKEFFPLGSIFFSVLIIIFTLFFKNKLKGGPPPPDISEKTVDRQDKKWRWIFLIVRYIMYAMNAALILLSS